MNYNFTLAKSLGVLKFNYTKQQVISILGEPDFVNKYIDEPMLYDDELSNEYLEYDELGLSISFCFDDDNQYTGLCISTKKIVLGNQDLYLLSKKEIIDTMKAIYKEYKIKYKCEYEKIEFEEFTSEEYIYDELGITLFFNDGVLNNVYVQKPENELILPEPKKKPKLYQLEPLETNLQMVSEPKTEYKRTKK